jgi:hypothetical protein
VGPRSSFLRLVRVEGPLARKEPWSILATWKGGGSISEFLSRKLIRRFRTFDTDADGRIERSDFETSATRLAEEFGHGPGSPERQRLLDLTLALWEHLATAADADRDGSVDIAEYKQAFANGLLVTEASFHQGYRPSSTPSWPSPTPTAMAGSVATSTSAGPVPS